MKKLWMYIVSIYFWIEVFGTAMILFPVALLIWLVTMPFDPNRRILHQFSCLWSNLVFFLNPLWHVTISGKENINRRATYVIVSNHQSGADILVLFTLRLHYKWVAKRSLFFYPFIGWNMAMNRYIALRRGKKSSMHLMMQRARQELLKGNSMMIFPEGTRSTDGRLQPFRSGAFHLAIDTQLPVLPVVISGTAMAIRKNSFLINPQPNIRVTILEPVGPEVYASIDPKQLAHEVHDRIAKELNRLEAGDHTG